MAFAAHLWDGHSVYRGCIIIFRLGSVGPMAIGTVGGIILFIIISLAMTAFEIHAENLCMAGRAVHGLTGGTGTLQMIGNCGMTLRALDVLVHRIGEFVIVPEEGNGIPLHNFMQVFILVAFHTGLVRNPGLYFGHIHNMRRVTG